MTWFPLIPVQFCSLSKILLVSYPSVNKTNIKWEYDLIATNPSLILLPFLNCLSVLSIGEQD